MMKNTLRQLLASLFLCTLSGDLYAAPVGIQKAIAANRVINERTMLPLMVSASEGLEEEALPRPEKNEIPVAKNNRYSTPQNTILRVPAPGVLSNDTDRDGGTLAALFGTGVMHGILTLDGDGSFVYTPDKGFTGSDSFTYYADDGMDTSEIATVNITVTGSEPALPVESTEKIL